MKIEDVRRHLTTPLTSPAYAPMISRFTDREYLNIVYRTNTDALRAVVPEPLQIDVMAREFLSDLGILKRRLAVPARAPG